LFFNQRSESLQIARQIIQNTGLDENLGILKQKKHHSNIEPREFLKWVMALSTCNLAQTMKADFVVGGLSFAEREAVVKDYVLESFRTQELVKLDGKDDVERMRVAVMAIVPQLQAFWVEADDPEGSGPGPRYYCVKEVLQQLGGEADLALHDALFELMYLQYQHYLKFFRAHLEKRE
jgi:hypothetical protein